MRHVRSTTLAAVAGIAWVRETVACSSGRAAALRDQGPAVATIDEPRAVDSERPDPPPAANTYKAPCTLATCSCAWVPYHVGDTWFVARACGSSRIVITPARFQIRPWNFDTMGEAAFAKAERLNRLYGIGAEGWKL